MIRIDAVWLAVEPLDMRAGTETALARVVRVFGEARAHHAYLFVNRRSNRIKVLARRHRDLALRASVAPGTVHLGECRIGYEGRDQPRAAAGAVDRLALVAHGSTSDDSRRLKRLY